MRRVIALILILVLPVTLSATIIHVATDGNDTTGDGSAETPYATIQKAIADTTPGDTIYVHEGTYTGEPAAGGYPMYGSAGNYIYVMGVPGENKPVFSSSETAAFTSMTGGEYPPHHFVLQDLIYNKASATAGSHCINIASSSQNDPQVHNVIVDNCEFYQQSTSTQMIKMAGVDTFLIKNCTMNASNAQVIGIAGVGCHDGEVYNCRVDSCLQGGIEFKGGSSEIVIRNNIVNMAYFAGMNLGGDTGSEYLRPTLTNMEDPNYEARAIDVYSNIIVDCDAAVSFDTAKECRAYNNLIVKTDSTRDTQGLLPNKGMIWIRHSSWSVDVPSNNNLFANNIVYFNTRENYWENVIWHTIVADAADSSSTHEFYNNVWFCFEDSSDSWSYWDDDGVVDYPTVLDNIFGGAGDPDVSFNGTLGHYIAEDTTLLAGEGYEITPPTGYQFLDFYGDAFPDPPPIGPFDMVADGGASPPVAEFTGTPTSGDAPLTVSFTDQSTNTPTSWSWDFGDESTPSTDQNPSHEYDEGTYTVTLTATNADGSDDKEKVNYIVSSSSTQPTQSACSGYMGYSSVTGGIILANHTHWTLIHPRTQDIVVEVWNNGAKQYEFTVESSNSWAFSTSGIDSIRVVRATATIVDYSLSTDRDMVPALTADSR